jgi:zinc finger FYVE domain-containing protein 26
MQTVSNTIERIVTAVQSSPEHDDSSTSSPSSTAIVDGTQFNRSQLSNNDVNETEESNNSTPILSYSELTRYEKTINLQIEVTKYVYSQNKEIRDSTSGMNLLTLFGSVAQKKGKSRDFSFFLVFSLISLSLSSLSFLELTERLILLHNFDLAFQIMQEFQLPLKPIYINCLTEMTRKKQTPKVMELLKNIQSTISDQEWDEVLLSCVEIYFNELQDEKTSEKLVERIVENKNKIRALITTGKLKAAYLQAVKLRAPELIREIQSRAKRIDARGIYDLCAKYLNSLTDVPVDDGSFSNE